MVHQWSCVFIFVHFQWSKAVLISWEGKSDEFLGSFCLYAINAIDSLFRKEKLYITENIVANQDSNEEDIMEWLNTIKTRGRSELIMTF